MKGQKGQAFILVLILLAVGALVIVPALNYAFTGLKSQRISEDALTTQYAADSALEDALWQMLNGGVLGYLNSDNTSYTYDFLFGLDRFKVDIKIPEVPESEWDKFKQIEVKVDVQPNWVEANAVDPTFTYVIRVSMPQWDLTNFGFTLPQGLALMPGSTRYLGPEREKDQKANNFSRDALVSEDGTMVLNEDSQWVAMTAGGYTTVYEWPPPDYDPENPSPYLLITEAGGSQTLEWMPVFAETGRRVLIQAFKATGTPGWGIHYVEPSFTGTGQYLETITTGPTGALGVAIYNIIIEVEGVTYQVVVAYDSTTTPPEMKIISYQIVE